ncbi:protein TolA [uncultured Paracoccus sp.]|uniref:protein TolA n=1 Tax=uncultured Paracoccus sp. TaxID=189685 RepID=UPI002626960E|nr:protein TolA [uncultured Paracoccus sp.]
MDRAGRIGGWVSGVTHAGLIAWVAVGGALFRGQPSEPIRMTNVETMTDAQFQQMAAATRGAGPVGTEAAAQPAQPAPPSAEVVEGGTVSVAPEAPQVDPLAMPAPETAPEPAPDLSELRAPQEAVAVASVAPVQPDAPAEVSGTVILPDTAPGRAVAVAAPGARPAPTERPSETAAPDSAPDVSDLQAPQPQVVVTDAAPAQPGAPAEPAAPADLPQAAPAPRQMAALPQPVRPAAPGSEAPVAPLAPPPEPGLAPLSSAVPLSADAARERRAERQAAARAEELARQAAAEAARQAAERAAAEQAAAEREAAEQEAAEQEARRLAEEAAAEERRLAEEAAAEERRLAEEAAAAAAREAAERERERLAREEADRRAAETAAAAEAARVETERRAVEERAREEAEAQRREEERLAAEAAAREQALARELAARAEAEAQAREQAERERMAPPDDALTRALELAMNRDLPLDGAGAEGGGGRAPSGPPLTQGERDGLRVAIQDCWNSGALSREATAVTVSVAFSMTPDGMPREDSVELIGSDGGPEQAVQQAFDVARRAIIRCGYQKEGYDLPVDKYGRWKDVIVDFSVAGSGISLR